MKMRNENVEKEKHPPPPHRTCIIGVHNNYKKWAAYFLVLRNFSKIEKYFRVRIFKKMRARVFKRDPSVTQA